MDDWKIQDEYYSTGVREAASRSQRFRSVCSASVVVYTFLWFASLLRKLSLGSCSMCPNVYVRSIGDRGSRWGSDADASLACNVSSSLCHTIQCLTQVSVARFFGRRSIQSGFHGWLVDVRQIVHRHFSDTPFKKDEKFIGRSLRFYSSTVDVSLLDIKAAQESR